MNLVLTAAVVYVVWAVGETLLKLHHGGCPRRVVRWLVGWVETLRILYDPREAGTRADLRTLGGPPTQDPGGAGLSGGRLSGGPKLFRGDR